jgi:hypothetical protein
VECHLRAHAKERLHRLRRDGTTLWRCAMLNGACGQIDILLFLLAALLALVVAVRRSAPRSCPRCAATDRRAWCFCATCGWPMWPKTPLIVRGVFDGPASSKLALDSRSPVSRLRVGWCQGANARDCAGHAVFPRQSVAASWSLLGAIAASLDCGTPEWTAYFKRLSRVLGAPSGSARWLAGWNDDPSRTQAEVVAAAAAAEEAGR